MFESTEKALLNPFAFSALSADRHRKRRSVIYRLFLLVHSIPFGFKYSISPLYYHILCLLSSGLLYVV